MKRGFLFMALFLILAACIGWSAPRVTVTAYWVDGVPAPKGRMLQYINDKFNMDFQVLQLPIDQYANKLTLAMSSGELADLIQVRDPLADGARIDRQLIDGKYVRPLDKYLKDYPNLLKYLSNPEAKRFAQWDNQYYVVPKRYFYHTTAFYYRKDLLDKYNLKIPVTQDDFYNTMKVVVNKENIPGYVSFGLYFGNHYWFGNYGGVGFGQPAWKYVNGKYVDMSISNEYKQALQFMNKLYKDRILDPEFVLLSDFAKFQEKFTTGKVACIPIHCEANYFYDSMVGDTQKNIPGAKVYGAYPPIGPMGPNNGLTGSPYGTVDMLISSTAKNPEKLLALWDFLFSPEGEMFNQYGIKGVHWTQDAKGNVVVNQAEVAKDTGGPSDPISKFRWFSDIQPDKVPSYSIDVQRQNELIAWGQKYGVSPYIVGFSSKTLVEKLPDLQKMRDEYYTKFITGELNIDAKWNEFVSSYKAGGYDTLEKEANAYALTPTGAAKSRK